MEIEGPVEAVVLRKPDGKRFIRPFANCGSGPAEHVGFHSSNGTLRMAGYEVEYIGPMAAAVARLLGDKKDSEPVIRAVPPPFAVS